MAEIKIKFDLSFSRRFMTAAATGAIMLCAVPELDSESVTLSTYYPAPSGVYTNMITTGNTYLARDWPGGDPRCNTAGGANTCIGVGTTAPGAKIHIVGVSQNTLAVDSPSYPEITMRVNGAIRNYNAVATSAGGYFGGTAVGDWIFRNDSGASIKFGRGGTADLTIDPSGIIVVRDSMRAAGTITTQAGAGCTDTYYSYPGPGGGVMALCAGQYVTSIDGFYTKKYMLESESPNGNARCCPCPPSGCGGAYGN